MFDQTSDAVRRYLRELDRELKRQGVVAADDALNDAREFLQGELLTLRQRMPPSACIELSGAELYARFVERFGSPRIVAQGYEEPVAHCGPPALAGQIPWKQAAAAIFILAGTVGLCVAGLREPPKLSPFTEVRYEDRDIVVVRFRGELHRLVSIDGIPAKGILQSARDQFGDLWQKRFAEDLVEVLWGMDHRPGKTVRLELRDPKTDKLIVVDKAAMTEANRRQVRDARNDDPRKPPKIAPFTEVRYEGSDVAIVRVRGELYRLVSLDGIPAKEILQATRDHFGELWQKRFAEDLVEVLWMMEHRPGNKVRLELTDPKTNKSLTMNVAMTEENRRQVWHARN